MVSLFLRDDASARKCRAETEKRERERERERESRPSGFNYLWRPFEAAALPSSFVSLFPSLFVTIIISITWFPLRYFTLAHTLAREPIRQNALAFPSCLRMERARGFSYRFRPSARANVFLLSLSLSVSLSVSVSLSLSLSLSLARVSSRNPGKTFRRERDAEREYLLPRVYLLRKQKFRFPRASVCQVNPVSSYSN